jgi:ABC-type dipeptide/oligopeptide/nickel transport system permease subunit
MQNVGALATTPEGRASRALSERAWWLCRRQPVGVVSSNILLFLMLVALAAPLIQTHDPVDVSGVGIEAPSGEHWFGTDRIGRDVFSRTVAGARISLGGLRGTPGGCPRWDHPGADVGLYRRDF